MQVTYTHLFELLLGNDSHCRVEFRLLRSLIQDQQTKNPRMGVFYISKEFCFYTQQQNAHPVLAPPHGVFIGCVQCHVTKLRFLS